MAKVQSEPTRNKQHATQQARRFKQSGYKNVHVTYKTGADETADYDAGEGRKVRYWYAVGEK